MFLAIRGRCGTGKLSAVIKTMTAMRLLLLASVGIGAPWVAGAQARTPQLPQTPVLAPAPQLPPNPTLAPAPELPPPVRLAPLSGTKKRHRYSSVRVRHESGTVFVGRIYEPYYTVVAPPGTLPPVVTETTPNVGTVPVTQPETYQPSTYVVPTYQVPTYSVPKYP